MSDYSEIDRLGAAVAPELPAEARRMLGLQLIGGNPQDLGARGEEPGAISTVLVLDNTIDQGRIAEGLETLLGESPTVVNGLTASRASAIYDRSSGGGGRKPLAESDTDAVVVTNLGESDDEFQQALEEIVASGTYTTGDGQSIEVAVPVTLLTTPEHGSWDEYKPMSEQIPLRSGVVSKADLFVTVWEPESSPPDETWNVSDALEFRDSVRERFPEVTEDAAARIRELGTYEQPESDDSVVQPFLPTPWRTRLRLRKVATTAAKSRQSPTVQVSDVEYAASLVVPPYQDIGAILPPSWQTIEGVSQNDQFDADVVETGPSDEFNTGTDAEFTEQITDAERTAACDLIEDIADEFEDESGAPVDVVIERIRMSSDFTSRPDEILDHLKNNGEAYELGGYLRSI